jgi:hypothetical protein
VLRGGGHEPVLVAVGVLALAVLLIGLGLRWSAGLAFGVALLGAQQAVRLALGSDALDAWAPLVGGLLLLVAELAWWSIERRVPAWAQPGVAARRLAGVLFTCAVASMVAALVVLAAGAPLTGGVSLELVGVLAAAAALALVAFVARGRSAVD